MPTICKQHRIKLTVFVYRMAELLDHIKLLYSKRLYSNVVELGSICLSMLEPVPEMQFPHKFQVLLMSAESLYHLGEYRRALAMYDKAINFRKCYLKAVGSAKAGSCKEFATDIDIRYQMYTCHMRLRQHREAITTLECIPQKQKTVKVLMALGSLYHQMGMERSAVSSYKEVVRECPLALEAIEGLLKLHVSGSEIHSLILESCASKGFQGDFEWLTRWIKALNFVNEKEWNKAIETMSLLERFNGLSTNHHILIRMGDIYNIMGENSKACATYERAHTSDPFCQKGLGMLAHLLYRQKKFPQLKQLVPVNIPTVEFDSETWVALAFMFYANKKTGKAAYMAQKACMLDPRNVEALLLKAYVLMDLKKFPDALAHYREAAYLAPLRYEAHQGVSNSYAMMGRHREALEAATAARKHLGQNSRTLSLYASLLMKDPTTLPQARDLLAQAIHLDDRYLPAIYLLATVMDNDEEREGAIRLLQSALSKYHPTVRMHHMIADLYTRNRQLEKAAAHYTLALALDPGNRKIQEAITRLDQGPQSMDPPDYFSFNDEDHPIHAVYNVDDSDVDTDDRDPDPIWTDLDMGMRLW